MIMRSKIFYHLPQAESNEGIAYDGEHTPILNTLLTRSQAK